MFKPDTKVEVNAAIIRRRYKNINIHPQMTWKPGTVVRSLGTKLLVRIVDRNKTAWQIVVEGVREVRGAE